MSFYITSKRGMTPWTSGIETWAEAVREAWAARQLGLDGEVCADTGAEMVAAKLRQLASADTGERDEYEALAEILHVEGFGGREDDADTEGLAVALIEERLIWLRETYGATL